MITAKENITAMIDSLARDITARVELYEGSALLQIFNRRDNLKAVTVERTGTQGKFFGFGVSHKLTANIIDKDRSVCQWCPRIKITTRDSCCFYINYKRFIWHNYLSLGISKMLSLGYSVIHMGQELFF
jgi:hypothetical protein